MLVIPSDKQLLAHIQEIAAYLKSQGETVPRKSYSDLIPSLTIPQPDTFSQSYHCLFPHHLAEM